MKGSLDPSQFGNQKNLSIEHYLVRLMHRIVSNVDKNSQGEVNAVLATFVDWSKAYSRQCHKLGIESFIKNGVRPSLIPLLTSYFQNRKIIVKFHGKYSEPKLQPGSGAQGATLGNWEFLSQTNNSSDCVPKDDRFKYVDDLSILEIINLLNIGLCSYNFKNQIPSDIPIHGQFINNDDLKSQFYLNEINKWTINQKMLISEKKTKAMIINFTNNYQFTTRLILNSTNIEVVDKIKILGTVINDNLTWNDNCQELISKVNKRMLLLKKIQSFGATIEEMVHCWIIYCRSLLEKSAVVWSSSLSQQNKDDLERPQKAFAKLVPRNKYNETDENPYENAVLKLNLQTLEERRKELCLNFAKNGIKNKTLIDLFPEKNNNHPMEKRNEEKYMVTKAHTDRMRNSSIIYMQNLLNEDAKHETTKFKQ